MYCYYCCNLSLNIEFLLVKQLFLHWFMVCMRLYTETQRYTLHPVPVSVPVPSDVEETSRDSVGVETTRNGTRRPRSSKYLKGIHTCCPWNPGALVRKILVMGRKSPNRVWTFSLHDVEKWVFITRTCTVHSLEFLLSYGLFLVCRDFGKKEGNGRPHSKVKPLLSPLINQPLSERLALSCSRQTKCTQD